MKYVSPIYKCEAVEACDVICESIVKIAYVQTEVYNAETGKMEEVTATQVSVNISNLF